MAYTYFVKLYHLFYYKKCQLFHLGLGLHTGEALDTTHEASTGLLVAKKVPEQNTVSHPERDLANVLIVETEKGCSFYMIRALKKWPTSVAFKNSRSLP